MLSEQQQRWKLRSAIPNYLRPDTPDEIRAEAERVAFTVPETEGEVEVAPEMEDKVVVRLPGDYATEELLLAEVQVAVRKARLLATGSEEPPLAGSSVSPEGPVTSPWDHNGAMGIT